MLRAPLTCPSAVEFLEEPLNMVGEKERISTMTLEAVLNRAGQMNRTERWTLWTACGTHEPDSLPRTETGGAQRPRYCPSCWTAFSADGVLWNPPCLPNELGV